MYRCPCPFPNGRLQVGRIISLYSEPFYDIFPANSKDNNDP
jgi:hypothetical protein